MAAREGIRAEEEHSADNLLGKRPADAGTMAENQIALEFANAIGMNGYILESAESGCDTVDHGMVADGFFHPGTRLLHAPS